MICLELFFKDLNIYSKEIVYEMFPLNSEKIVVYKNVTFVFIIYSLNYTLNFMFP